MCIQSIILLSLFLIAQSADAQLVKAQKETIWQSLKGTLVKSGVIKGKGTIRRTDIVPPQSLRESLNIPDLRPDSRTIPLIQPQQWQAPEKLMASDSPFQANVPRIISDDNGNVFAVWKQSLSESGGSYTLWASRYMRGSGWELPHSLSNHLATGIEGDDYELAVSQGKVTVFWRNWGPSNGGTFSADYIPGQGWGQGQLLDGVGIHQLKVVKNSTGHFLFLSGDPSGWYLGMKWFVPGVGWGSPVNVQVPSTAYRRLWDVVIDDEGNAIFLWGTNEGLVSIRYLPNLGWETFRTIPNIGDIVQFSRMVMDSTGHAFVVWLRFDGRRGVSRYVAGVGWETKDLPIASSFPYSSPINYPNVVVDRFGNAMVVGSFGSVLYRQGAGWGEIEQCPPVGAIPTLAVDNLGNFFAAGASYERDTLKVARYSPGKIWEQINSIDLGNTLNLFVNDIQIDVDRYRNVTVAWGQITDTAPARLWNIWAARYE